MFYIVVLLQRAGKHRRVVTKSWKVWEGTGDYLAYRLFLFSCLVELALCSHASSVNHRMTLFYSYHWLPLLFL